MLEISLQDLGFKTQVSLKCYVHIQSELLHGNMKALSEGKVNIIQQYVEIVGYGD